MNARTRFPVVHLLAAALVGVGAAACDSDGSSFTGPGDDDGGQQQFSTVDGRVESTHETASDEPTSVRGASATAARAPAAEAATVAVAHVRSDGTLDVLAEADVQGNGSFSVDEVPADRSDLVVVARSDAGAEVGRVLVHGETEGGAVTTTAPINAETTVEGHVFATLTEAGVADEIRNTAQLALLLRMDESTAGEVAASARAIQEVSEGVRASVEAMNRTIASLGAQVEGQARAEAMLQAAVEHAHSRHGGTEAETANEAFLQAGIEALIQAGASAEEASLATTAAATGLDRAMAEANENARLELAKSAVALNLTARERLVAEQSDSPSNQVAADALARARADVDASASMSEVARALLAAEASFEEELTAMILSNLSHVPENVRAEIEARLETAFAEADFSTGAEAAVSVDEIAQAVVEYRERVRTTVQAFVDSLPGDAGASASLSAGVMIAARGGPAIGS